MTKAQRIAHKIGNQLRRSHIVAYKSKRTQHAQQGTLCQKSNRWIRLVASPLD